MNLPNKLTVLRVCLIPLFLLFLIGGVGGEYSRYIAVAVFIIASLTDMLDGYIARKYNLVTNFGKFMDPLADKLLVCAALIAMMGLGDIPALAVILIISREFIITGFRTLAADNNVVIAASKWGKIKTITQMVMVVYLLFGFVGEIFVIIGNILIILAVFFTVLSAIDYVYKNRELLNQK